MSETFLSHIWTHIPEVPCWFEIRWMWRRLKYSDLFVTFRKAVRVSLRFATWCIIPLEAALRRVNSNTRGRLWLLYNDHLVRSVPKWAEEWFPFTTSSLNCGLLVGWIRSHQSRRHVCNLLKPNVSEPVWTGASVIYIWQEWFLLVFLIWFLIGHVIQRWYSTNFDCI